MALEGRSSKCNCAEIGHVSALPLLHSLPLQKTLTNQAEPTQYTNREKLTLKN